MKKLWAGLGGFKMVLEGLGGSWRVWKGLVLKKILGGSGRVHEGLEGSRRLLECHGGSCDGKVYNASALLD